MPHINFKYGKKNRRIAAFLLLFLFLTFAALTGIGNYFVNYSLVPAEGRTDEVTPASDPSMDSVDHMIIDSNRAKITQQKNSWLKTAPPEIHTILSEDGLKLEADTFCSSDGGHRWVLLAHGYGSRREKMRNIGSFYAQKGFHVLIPDMRAHGRSEGSYIGMGWLDRTDLLLWIEEILKQDPQAEIVLHGVSMGGAAVMMVSGEPLPSQVKCIVEDCGYTSAWDIFADELDYLFQLPPFPIMEISNVMVRLRAGYDLREASALNQVKKCTVPMLFIHGGNDTFVRPEMAEELYAAAACEKKLLLIPGAGHGESYLREPDTYFDTVFSFIETHLDG